MNVAGKSRKAAVEGPAGQNGNEGFMKTYELIAPCHFGLEAVLKREISDLGYEIVKVEDGRITFKGDEAAVCRANIFLRTAERILIKVGSFHAETFEELFQGTKSLPWEEWLPEDGKFWVTKAASIKSRLSHGVFSRERGRLSRQGVPDEGRGDGGVRRHGRFLT